MFRIVILLLFLLSGFSSLLYEVIWIRVFGLIFGNTTLAVSTVLTAFMLGLGLGSLTIGNRIRRFKNQLKIYALLEVGIGLSALLVPALQESIVSFLSLIYTAVSDLPFLFYIIKFVIAFLIMFPATFLMGGTLPVIAQAIIKEKRKIGFHIGILYGINTFGAMLGAFITGFYLISVVGVIESLFLGVILNLVVGLIAYQLSRFIDDKSGDLQAKQAIQDQPFPFEVKLVFIIIAISGFCALGYEVLWTRLLVYVFSNSVYAFTIMLTTFLFGIAFGSFIGGKLADRISNSVKQLGFIQIAIGIISLLISLVLINFSELHNLIFTVDRVTTWWQWTGVRFLESFIIMLFPTLLMGASFPIAIKILTPALDHLGRRIGLLYFLNTIGGVVGSFLTGFVFIILLGTSATIGILIVINIMAGIVLLYWQKINNSKIFIFGAVTIFVTIILILIFIPTTPFQKISSIIEKDFPLIDFREGIEGTVTVHQKITPNSNLKRIDVNGLNVAGTSFLLRTIQTLQGHLPFLIHGNAKDVLQIGFGSGQTSHAALLYPLNSFRLVEISREVLELSQIHFTEINKDVINNPKFQYTISDAKNFVKYTDEKYDIIMNDANYPVSTGSSSLFTRDHFENCIKKLKKGGILSTWFAADMAPEDFKIVLRTFQSVFPHCMLWMAPNCINKHIVLMGAIEPITINFKRLQNVFLDKSIKDEFAGININSAFDLLSCFVLDRNEIKNISSDVVLNTDNKPILEFSTSAVRSRDFCAYQNLGMIFNRLPDSLKFITNLSEDPQKQKSISKKIKRYLFARKEILKGMLYFYQGKTQQAMQTLIDGSRIIPESDIAVNIFNNMDLVMNDLMLGIAKNPDDLKAKLNFVHHQIGMEQYDSALRILRKLSLKYKSNSLVMYELGRCATAKNQLDSALVYFQKSLEINNQNPSAYYYKGSILLRKQKYNEAMYNFEQALKLEPMMAEAYNGVGKVYRYQNENSKAINYYKKSLEISEFQPHVYSALGDCYLGINNLAQSIYYYNKTLQMGYNLSETFFKIGNAYFLVSEYESAIAGYKNAVKTDSVNSEIYYNMGNTYIRLGDLNNAIDVYEKAIQLDTGEADYYNNLAMSYRTQGNFKKAMDVFNKGLAIHRNSDLLKKNAEETKRLFFQQKRNGNPLGD